MVDAERIRADLDAMLRIPSVDGTPAEADVQSWFAQALADDGFEVTSEVEPVLESDPQFPGMEVPRDTLTTVLAHWPGTGGGPTIVLNGHTDVVPPGDGWHGEPFIPDWQEGPRGPRVIARGACDMKAGLVAAWAAVRSLPPIAGDIIIAPVSAEEDGGAGTFHALRAGLTADMCIIPEPTDLALVPANAGALTFRLTVPGAAVHASRRTSGISAIEKFWPIMQALSNLERERNARTDALMNRWDIPYPLSIGQVTAGNWASTVPDVLIAEGRYGVALDESVDDARAEFEARVADTCEADPWLRDHPVTVEWWGGQFESGRTELGSALIDELRQAHQEITGDIADLFAAPYGSDLRLFTGIGGIPTVQYGPGDSAVAHAPNEYVDLNDVVTCATVLANFLVRVGDRRS